MTSSSRHAIGRSYAALALTCGLLLGQDSADIHIDRGAKKMLASSDAAFALQAAQSGLAEVQLGELAASKASSPELKAFGQQMIDEHTKVNDQLKSIAKDKNMTITETLSASDQALVDRLKSLAGVPFDKEYAAGMVKAHENDVKDFQKEATRGADPAIKNFAAQTLPLLQSHLEKIKAIRARLSASS